MYLGKGTEGCDNLCVRSMNVWGRGCAGTLEGQGRSFNTRFPCACVCVRVCVRVCVCACMRAGVCPYAHARET